MIARTLRVVCNRSHVPEGPYLQYKKTDLFINCLLLLSPISPIVAYCGYCGPIVALLWPIVTPDHASLRGQLCQMAQTLFWTLGGVHLDEGTILHDTLDLCLVDT